MPLVPSQLIFRVENRGVRHIGISGDIDLHPYAIFFHALHHAESPGLAALLIHFCDIFIINRNLYASFYFYILLFLTIIVFIVIIFLLLLLLLLTSLSCFSIDPLLPLSGAFRPEGQSVSSDILRSEKARQAMRDIIMLIPPRRWASSKNPSFRRDPLKAFSHGAFWP